MNLIQVVPYAIPALVAVVAARSVVTAIAEEKAANK